MRNNRLMLLISAVNIIGVYLSDCDEELREPTETALRILMRVRRKELAKVIDKDSQKLTK